MTKQQQEQKKIEQAQKAAAKNQVEQRNQTLLQKEFYAREWKAEIDLMKYEMEYYDTAKVYTVFKTELEKLKKEAQPAEVDTTQTIENQVETTSPTFEDNVKDN